MAERHRKEAINILTDQPIEKEDQDKFSHKVYAQTLLEIIRNLIGRPICVNIGLFGKWGAGKTSIINLFKNALEQDHQLRDKVKVVIYNVWKHSKDSLRRQFLVFLDGDEGLGTNIGIKDKLDKTTHRSCSIPRLRDWRTLLLFLSWGIVIFTVTSLIQQREGWIKLAFSGISSFLIIVVTVLSKTLIQQRTTSTTFHRIDQADQFEENFKQMIGKAKKQYEKIVIVFDDLDRCPEHTIVETLSMIKTFLGEKDCVYIVPCDEDGIKKHLKKVMHYTDGQEDEFIKKFFQVSIRIPPFIEEDIFSYVQYLTKESGFPKGIEKVMIAAFWETPRHVKQFLNNLSALRVLAVQKEDLPPESPGSVTKDIITNNLPFLAKVEAIREKWPGVFQSIIEDPELLRALQDYATGKEVDSESERLEEIVKKNKGLKNFLYATADIIVDDATPFLKLAQPSYLASLPDSAIFKTKVITGDIEYVKQKVTDETKGKKYLEALIKIADERRRADYADQSFTALHMLVSLYPDVKRSFDEELIEQIIENLRGPDLLPKLISIPIANLFEIIVTAKKSQKCENILSALIQHIGEDSHDS